MNIEHIKILWFLLWAMFTGVLLVDVVLLFSGCSQHRTDTYLPVPEQEGAVLVVEKKEVGE